ncbi:phosphoglycolate phosphatase [Pseudooceanicola sp.]|uniref:phosphoglycolate phosphatase n=1 Tax=Pseudooceanicola sp. TaxID=1914328 RepID=UPI0035C6A9BB
MAEALVAFDLDGTLIDSAPDIHAIANAVLAAEGLEGITLDEARSFVGRGAANFVAQMRAVRGIQEAEQERLLAAYLARYQGAVGLTSLYPGVRAALKALRDAGHTLLLCTNKPEAPTRAVLDHFDLAGFFEVVIGGDTLPVRKPDPAPLLTAYDRAARDGPRIFVGDSEIDAETAEAAGVPFLLYTEGYRKAPAEALPHHARFDQFDTLLGLVDGLL